MAELAFVAALSHGPLLATPPDLWTVRADADRASSTHFFRGQVLDYAALVAARHADVQAFDAQSQPAVRRERYDACQRSLDQLAASYRDAQVDLAIIVGNDQRELFSGALRPAITVIGSPDLPNVPPSPERQAELPPGVSLAEEGHCPPEGAVYPGAPRDALAIVKALTADGIDCAWSEAFPAGAHQPGVPHAFGFVYRRLMEDRPPPSVPIIINAGVQPNRPTVARCLDYGTAIDRAIRALPDDLRVGLIASGGLSHFVVDEDFDRQILDAVDSGRTEHLAAIEESLFEGASAEIRNWLPVVAIANAHRMKVQQRDYIACYRTEAGTGSGMGFVRWATPARS
jgi:hypothetical protein